MARDVFHLDAVFAGPGEAVINVFEACRTLSACHSQGMSNRELVIDLVNKLPEDTSLEEIAREIELIAGIGEARQQAARGEGVDAGTAKRMVDSWAVQ